jgi:hypothetical protein
MREVEQVVEPRQNGGSLDQAHKLFLDELQIGSPKSNANSLSPIEEYKNNVRKQIDKSNENGSGVHDRGSGTNTPLPRESDTTKALENKLAADTKNLDPAEREKFAADMKVFLTRAAKQGLDEKAEVDKTLENCDRLLNSSAGAYIDKINGSEKGAQLRSMLAEQIMAEAAYPSQTDQGYYGTCTVTAIETRTWFDKPSVASSVIADQALNGKWVAPDGREVKLPQSDYKLDPLSPDPIPSNGMRSFAGQLFQATALSDIGSRGEVDAGKEEYYRTDGNGKEYWADANGKKIGAFNGLNDWQTANELRRLDGDNTEFLCYAPSAPNDHVVSFTSKEDFIQKLTDAQNQGKMPLVIAVAAGDPFFGNGGGHELNHAICIDSYDPVTRTVVIDNQWGDSFDWGTSKVMGSPSDRNTSASIDDFYPATVGTQELVPGKELHLY